MDKIKSTKGITLIVLVITIIVMIILATVSLNLAVGDNGLIKRFRESKENYQKETDEQETNMNVIKNDLEEITDGWSLKGKVPQFTYEIYSDTTGQNRIDTSKLYEREYVGVKVTNASEFTDIFVKLEDKDGNTINSTTVSGFEGYFKTQNNGKYNITVTGKNREGTKRKIQTVEVNNIGQEISYTITYNLNGGTISNQPTTFKKDTESFTLPRPTKTGYVFLNWTGSNDVSSGLDGYTSSSPYVASSRDHILGNEFNVTEGEKYGVFVRGARTKGSLNLQGGIWYTAQTSGASYDGYVGSFSEIASGLFYKEIIIPSGKTKGRFYIQLEQTSDNLSTAWNLYDMHVVKVENPTIPKGSEGNKSYTANWVVEKTRFDYVATNSSQEWIGKVQTYTVPYSGTYRITVAGAQGGWGWQSHKGMPTGTHGYPGYGAIMSQDVKLTKGQTIQVIVGRTGQNGYGQIKTHTEESKICWAQSGKSGWPYDAKTAAPYYADPDAQSIGGKGGYSQVTFPDSGFMKADGGGGGEGHGHDNIMGGGSVSAQAENCTTYSGGTNTQFNCASQRVFTTCNNRFNSTGGNGNVNNHNQPIGRTGDKPSEDYQGAYTQANGYAIFELINCE